MALTLAFLAWPRTAPIKAAMAPASVRPSRKAAISAPMSKSCSWTRIIAAPPPDIVRLQHFGQACDELRIDEACNEPECRAGTYLCWKRTCDATKDRERLTHCG